MYGYINGSSGQVEIYPQDLERIWIAPASPVKVKKVKGEYSAASRHDREFYISMQKALANALKRTA